MHPLLAELLEDFSFSGDLPQDAFNFLTHHQCPNTAVHSRSVAQTAVNLAARFGVDRQKVETAGWLHDISAVYPNPQRVRVSQQLGLEILPEERQVPLLLHQKISAVIAADLFSIREEGVLQAIRCHTTLKANSSQLDLVLFVADKLAWDQRGEPPFKSAVESALDISLEAAAWAYLDFLMNSGKIQIAHPWMLEACLQLKP
jgi:predicted HD superfamily hydrolase involved in NAD metabolism